MLYRVAQQDYSPENYTTHFRYFRGTIYFRCIILIRNDVSILQIAKFFARPRLLRETQLRGDLHDDLHHLVGRLGDEAAGVVLRELPHRVHQDRVGRHAVKDDGAGRQDGHGERASEAAATYHATSQFHNTALRSRDTRCNTFRRSGTFGSLVAILVLTVAANQMQ